MKDIMKNTSVIFITLVFSLVACSNSEKDVENPNNNSDEINEVTSVTKIISNISINISTDKATYLPGEKVTFVIDKLPSEALSIRYRTLDNIVAEVKLTTKTWTWTAPPADFTSYMVDLYSKNTDGSETIVGTIAIDVSSDWKRFPRYGFVSDYGKDKTSDVINTEMDWLCRCHINGIQFYDWHNKHHWPLGGTRTNPAESYRDIGNRTVYASTVKNYISAQHQRGMSAMFYNLCYGALDDATSDGVKDKWYSYCDVSHREKDCLALPDGWKSSIFITDPGNSEWQAYIAQRNDDVYANYDFDGYHIDQVGNRGIRYDYDGNRLNNPKGFASFIMAMKKAHPTKKLVMNAVAGYGAESIAGTNDVDFLYNEVWSDQPDFSDLKTIIDANNVYSNNTLKTVFAAYMSYDKANTPGEFNSGGVLLTDAVIFALGGSHLELGGDHNLCKEYFPNSTLKLRTTLKTSLMHYYDFMTGYENILRGTGSENQPVISCSSQKIASCNPKLGYIITYSKLVENMQIIHFLNFTKANSLSWRDLDGTMPEPPLLSTIAMQIKYSKKANKIWVASPDINGGVPQEITFIQKNGIIDFFLPSLKYWTMLVIE